MSLRMKWIGAMFSAIAGYFGVNYATRALVKKTANSFTKKIMTDPYHENLWEFFHASNRVSPQIIVETNLRSESGQIIERPLGSAKKHISFSGLMFDVAQLARFPLDEKVEIETKVAIGPKAAKPLIIETPLMIAGMAYGLSLSAQAKIAMAKGATLAGTATNTGEGAFLPAERKAAKKLIVQYNRAKWNKSKKILRQADMLEIQLGQGAMAGLGHGTKAADLTLSVSWKLGLMPGEDAVISATLPGVNNAKDFKNKIAELREITNGVPVGVKMCAGKRLEEDLELAVQSGVDFIALDGAQGGSVGSPPMIQDDFGLPTLMAISRAGQYFENKQLKGKVSLIIGGGLYTPGDFLKAIALGADAIYLGTMALFAMSHTQVLKAMPLEPPTQVVWQTGQYKNQFNVDEAAQNLAKFLKSCTLEMEEGARALGKTSIYQIDKSDLMALDPYTAAITGVDLAYDL